MMRKEKDQKESTESSFKTTSAFSLPKEFILSNSVSSPNNPNPSWISTSLVLCPLFWPLSPPLSLSQLPLTPKSLPSELSRHAKAIEIEGCMEEVMVSELGFEKWDRIRLNRDRAKNFLQSPWRLSLFHWRREESSKPVNQGVINLSLILGIHYKPHLRHQT